MTDFDGKKPLVFRDGIERQFWGAVFANAHVTADQADSAVIEMRIRQKETMKMEGTCARAVCAVCFNYLIGDDGKPMPHDYGCPLGERT